MLGGAVGMAHKAFLETAPGWGKQASWGKGACFSPPDGPEHSMERMAPLTPGRSCDTDQSLRDTSSPPFTMLPSTLCPVSSGLGEGGHLLPGGWRK